MSEPRLWHPFWWLPIAVIVVLAWVNGTMPPTEPAEPCPAVSDGPQFACWLQEHPDGR